jgi:hypothetical protein
VEGSCEHGNESSGVIKYWKIQNNKATGGFSNRCSLTWSCKHNLNLNVIYILIGFNEEGWQWHN